MPEQELVSSPLLLDRGQYAAYEILMIDYVRVLLVGYPEVFGCPEV